MLRGHLYVDLRLLQVVLEVHLRPVLATVNKTKVPYSDLRTFNACLIPIRPIPRTPKRSGWFEVDIFVLFS